MVSFSILESNQINHFVHPPPQKKLLASLSVVQPNVRLFTSCSCRSAFPDNMCCLQLVGKLKGRRGKMAGLSKGGGGGHKWREVTWNGWIIKGRVVEGEMKGKCQLKTDTSAADSTAVLPFLLTSGALMRVCVLRTDWCYGRCVNAIKRGPFPLFDHLLRRFLDTRYRLRNASEKSGTEGWAKRGITNQDTVQLAYKREQDGENLI